MRALALLLTLAAPLCAQSGYDEFMRDDLDPYGGLQRREAAPQVTVAPNYVAPQAPQNAYAGVAQQGFVQVGGVNPAQAPWSGVWWPRKPCELAFQSFAGGLSPLEKYDSLVYSYYGRIPGAAAWEADPQNGHNEAQGNGTDWSGHCNGLAAAAILEPEPRQTIRLPLGNYGTVLKLIYQHPAYAPAGSFRDGRNDYTQGRGNGYLDLTVADQKGWLCEMYMNVYTQQFQNQELTGTRSDSPVANLNDPRYRDIHPHYFHYLLQAFVQRGQAVVSEVDPGFPVNNHPLYKYESQSVYYPYYRKYSVTTTVYMADYGRGYNEVGTNVMKQTYTYDLMLDAQGRIAGGEWTGASMYNHPDFIWIPTGVAPADNGYSNAAMNYGFAKWLLSGGRR